MRFAVVVALVGGCSYSQGTTQNAIDGPTSTGDVMTDSPVPSDAIGVHDAPPCVDSDGDTVCDNVDRCPGFDDRLDADGDSIPDGCDDWPCGVKPVPPANKITQDEVFNSSHRITSLTGTKLDGAALLVVAPGATVNVTTAYSILDCISPMAIDQIEVGLVPGTRSGCIYDANPQGNGVGSCGTQTTASATMTFTAPATRGVYAFRFRVGQDPTCNSHTGWWTNVAPGVANTVATVCVH